MQWQAIAIQRRTAKLVDALGALEPEVLREDRARAIFATLVRSCREMEVGYRHACTSRSPDEFIARISAVTRSAKKTKTSMMLLTQLGYVPIAAVRDMIFEARALENIFLASRNTAKRRHSGGLVSRRNR